MSETFHKTKFGWRHRCIYNPTKHLRWSLLKKIDDGLPSLTIFENKSIVDVRLDSEYASK